MSSTHVLLPDRPLAMSEPRFSQLIWATRGGTWGFRFLLDAGLHDPLPENEQAFSGLTDAPNVWARRGRAVAVRVADPQGRRDSAGRVIPHEFVAFGPLAESVTSVEDALTLLWPLVEDTYRQVWDAASPPIPGDHLVFD